MLDSDGVFVFRWDEYPNGLGDRQQRKGKGLCDILVRHHHAAGREHHACHRFRAYPMAPFTQSACTLPGKPRKHIDRGCRTAKIRCDRALIQAWTRDCGQADFGVLENYHLYLGQSRQQIALTQSTRPMLHEVDGLAPAKQSKASEIRFDFVATRPLQRPEPIYLVHLRRLCI